MVKKNVTYKRRVGRPRKRGPKAKRKYISKKPKIDGRTLVSHRKYYNYKIIVCRGHKQVKKLKRFEHLNEAYLYLNELKELNKSVIFNKTVNGEVMSDHKEYEYVLLEENSSGMKKNSMLKDEYGRFRDVETSNNSWVILDSMPMRIEETFWVFGYDNRSDRKTFQWIYENILLSGIESKYDFKRVLVYKNKVIFKDDNEKLDIIICKDKGDAIKFYNLLARFTKKDKIKNVYFIGSYNKLGEKRKSLEEAIMEHTGWTKKRVQMDSNTFNRGKK